MDKISRILRKDFSSNHIAVLARETPPIIDRSMKHYDAESVHCTALLSELTSPQMSAYSVKDSRVVPVKLT